MDGYKDGDRRRSDALEVTRPLVRGSRNPLHKTPPATCHAALIGNCQCETGNTFILATFTTPCALPSQNQDISQISITPLNFTLFLRYHPRSSKPRNTLSTRNGCKPIIAAKDAKSAKAVEPCKKKLCIRKRTSREAKRFAPYSTRYCTFYTAKNLIGFSGV